MNNKIPPTKVKATLKSRITADGTTFIKPNVPLGRIYYVYPESLLDVLWEEMHSEVGAIKSTRRPSVIADATSPTGKGGYIPIELLELEQN